MPDQIPEVCLLCLGTIQLAPNCLPICTDCAEQLKQLPPKTRMERAGEVIRAIEARRQTAAIEKTGEVARQACVWLKEAAQNFGDVLSLAKQQYRDHEGKLPPGVEETEEDDGRPPFRR